MIQEVIDFVETRKKLKISRAEAARHLKIPEFSLYRWERGRTTPRTLYLERLRGVLRRLQHMIKDDQGLISSPHPDATEKSEIDGTG